MAQSMIDIEWQIEPKDRDNYFVRIDCYKKENSGKVIKYDCCQKSQEGCNVTACGCNPNDGWKIQLYDKNNNLLDEKEYQGPFSAIVIVKNNQSIPSITIKK